MADILYLLPEKKFRRPFFVCVEGLVGRYGCVCVCVCMAWCGEGLGSSTWDYNI